MPVDLVLTLTGCLDLLSETEETRVYLGLVDIMFAYVYDHRTTEGENQVP